MRVGVVITAGGSGVRFGGDMPKQFLQLSGKPILAYTIEAFDKHEAINSIVVAVPWHYVVHTSEITKRYGFTKINKIVPGGANRADSVFAALKQLPHDTDIVLIHDGVRPFVPTRLISDVVEAVRKYGAAVAGIPLTDTLKEVDECGKVIKTPDRKRFWRVQTPQGFRYDLILEAYAQGEKDGILTSATDDAMLVERLGVDVRMVEGDEGNVKITTGIDLELAKVLVGC